MIITSVSPSKGKLFEVTLDDGQKLWLHADLLAEAALHTGDSLSAEDIAKLRHRAVEHRAYEYGLYLLEKRGYSYRELYDKLMHAQNAEEEAVLTALEKLMRYGFLNDARYAEQLARHFVEGKKYGIRRAEYEMRHRGLSQTDIDDALAEFDDPVRISETLLELLHKKYARYLSDPDDRKAIEKVTAALVRRGFTYQQIRFAIEDYYASPEDEEEGD